jgi:hypothetical protein
MRDVQVEYELSNSSIRSAFEPGRTDTRQDHGIGSPMIDISRSVGDSDVSAALTTLLFVISKLAKRLRGGLTPALQRSGP